MFNYIEKLREKPESTKKVVAALVATLCAGIILFFWIFSVLPDLGQQKEINDRVQSAGSSPISSLTQIFSQGASGIGTAFSELKSKSSGFFGGAEIIKNSDNSPATTSTTASAISTTTVNSISTTTEVIQ